ncbi:deoxyribodipyrimidine photo-lyase-like, partial [Teleopsis dalmanni]
MRIVFNIAKNTYARLVFMKIMKRTKSSNTTKPQKKTKLLNSTETSVKTITTEDATTSKSNITDFAVAVQEQRLLTAENIIEFPFKKKRVRILTTVEEVKEHTTGGILYWMSRDARVQDNWALLFAQKLALKMQLPLIVAFCLVPKFLNATIRHYKFMLGGLEEVEKDLQELNIPFYLLLGPAAEHIPKFVKEFDIGAVVCDFAPLRVPRKWIDDVKNLLPKDIPLTQVDAHNIVPVWIASDKQEYAARTIRNKINSKLGEYLTEFPPIV